MVDASHCVFNIGNYQSMQSNQVISSTDDVEQTAGAVSVYPNPMTNYATVELDNVEATEAILELVDITGRILRQYQVNASSITIERVELSTGVYFYRLRDTKELLAQGKLIVK